VSHPVDPGTSTSRLRKRLWTVAGWIFAWLVLMAVIQRGLSGYLIVFAGMCFLVLLALLYRPFTYWLWSIRSFIAVPAVLAAWIWFAGSYSYSRDAAMMVLATTASVLAFAGPRMQAMALLARIRGTPISAPPQPWSALFQACWLLLCWLLVSLADLIGESGRIEPHGNVVAPASVREEWKILRVGLALSGGGYRAAVMHAGVLDQLGQYGVPVTNLSTVSGGSIIGAFIAAADRRSNSAKR
jgi:Patatin-like phospholipase